jgi:hypothetical protein
LKKAKYDQAGGAVNVTLNVTLNVTASMTAMVGAGMPVAH